ncbi:uncharacterized protein LOC128278347 [Anopheles cruzii]|uniref:uncharacterized protein LOC128278347 n=1 Tax=Anopheles cruzii TaxID=68878 RepID=UPI0022EC6484|nr:uncharacterized protein LOC128278347 [Anopheles cruzii]
MVLICEQHAENGPKMLKQFLCALGPLIPGLPKDPRTALEESIGPWSNESIEMQGGVYWHRGLENGIRANRATAKKDLTFDIQVDEVLLEQMTKPTFLAWIIMARLHEGSKPPGEPFVVGVFCGDAQPHCEEFLGPFIEEAERLCEAPLKINGDSVTVKPRVIITDVAARAFVKGTVHQSNYYGCPKCTIKGKFVSRTIITFFGKRNTNSPTHQMDPPNGRCRWATLCDAFGEVAHRLSPRCHCRRKSTFTAHRCYENFVFRICRWSW